MGEGSIPQGIRPSDHGPDCATLQPGYDFVVCALAFRVCRIAQRHSQDICILGHCRARVDRNRSLVLLASIAYDNDSTVTRDNFKVIGKIDVREHLEDQVDALSLGQTSDFAEIVLRCVVNRVIGALFRHQPESFGAAGRCNDRHSSQPGKLDRSDPYCAAATVNE